MLEMGTIFLQVQELFSIGLWAFSGLRIPFFQEWFSRKKKNLEQKMVKKEEGGQKSPTNNPHGLSMTPYYMIN